MKPTIPIITPTASHDFHFRKVPWKLNFSPQQHLFHINRIEDFRDKLNFPLSPHRKTIYDLIFLTEGSSIRSKGLNQYHIYKNQFFFLPPLQITSHESMSEDAKGFYLHFSDQIFIDNNNLQFLQPFSFWDFLVNPIVTVPHNKIAPILNIFSRLESLYIQLKKQDLKLVSWYLLSLFTEVYRFVESEKVGVRRKKSSAILLTEQYKNALTQHIYQKQTVKDYAELLFVTPNHLNKCVKSTINKTAQMLLNEMLILEAKALLKYSNFFISEIAEKFDRTPSNFARFFKTQTGFTPKQYVDFGK